MTLFTFIEKDEIHLAPETKVIPSEAFSQLMHVTALVEKTQEQETAYRIQVAKECESLKELAENAGFEEGMKKWNSQLELLESEIHKVRKEMESAIVPLAVTAVKKIIGKELQTHPDTIKDIVANALKTVLHHRRVVIYVNQNDLEYVEKERPRLKSLFEDLESLTITTRDDIETGGCVIETEAGIINAKLESQFLALEAAFRNFFQNRKNSAKGSP